MEAKILLADVCVFGHFGWLSPAAVHSPDSRFDPGVKWRIHGSSIVTYLCKKLFLLHWNSCKQCSESLMCCCFWLTVTNVHAKWWIHCLLISSTPLLSHATSIYDRPKWVCGVFLLFSGTTSEFGQTQCSASCVCTTVFKVSIPPLNRFWRSRVRVTLINLLLCLDSFFPHQKSMLYQHMTFRFFHCFEILQQ